MGKACVQEQRREKTPVFPLHDNRVRLERADPMQNFRVVPIPNRNLEQECNRVEENEDQNGGRVPQLMVLCDPTSDSRRPKCGLIAQGFQMSK